MRQLTLFGCGILTLSLASFWTLSAQEVVAHVTTNNDRGYEFPRLAPGQYHGVATKDGFLKSSAHNSVLTLNQICNLPVALEFGHFQLRTYHST